ncbi:MAG: ABC transporter permease [Methylacidiphilales bacterium]|nr:ABC transporter permease [Candidatus Methylacidiphilales bacterium]
MRFDKILLIFFSFCGLCFLLVPFSFIILYAFSPNEKTFDFPIAEYTTKWFSIIVARSDVWNAVSLSFTVAFFATLLALIIGTMTSIAVSRYKFFGRENFSLLLILPIALPGIITGIALRSSITILEIPFSTFTIVLGHATFTIVVIYNNVIARLRRLHPNCLEASYDLGANIFQAFFFVLLPQMYSALFAGAMLAFALSFDEIIVTTFTAGQQTTLPIWMLDQLIRPRQKPITNVVAIFIILFTIIPIIYSFRILNKHA